MNPFAETRFLVCSLLLCLTAFTVQAASGSIHPDTVAPTGDGDIFDDAPNWELGTVFRPELDGVVTQARVFSMWEEPGHEVRLWRNADNTLLAGPIPWDFGGNFEWITLDIPDVPVEANQDYTISITTTAEGYYASLGGYFAEAGNNGLYLAWPQGAGVFGDTIGVRPTGSFNNASYLRDVVFVPDLSGSIMRIQGNGVLIVDGANRPSTADGTDLGGKGLNAGGREQSYTILNLGEADLVLNGSPRVAIAGANPEDFAVTAEPAESIAGGGSTTFTVTFTPSAYGVRNATVSIPHADSPADPYDFAIQGEGLDPGAGVLGNDGIGTDSRTIGNTQIHGNRFMSPGDLRITELHAMVVALPDGSFSCAVYSDNDGFADQLLGSTVEVFGATNGWNTFPLSGSVDLTAGDYYWLVIWSDTETAVLPSDPVTTAYVGDYDYVGLGGVWPDPITLTTPIAWEGRTYCIYAEGIPLTPAPGPMPELRGNNKLIVCGDMTPSVRDGSDFGSLPVGTGTLDRTFRIENSGLEPLNLTGDPVVNVTGTHAGDFQVTAPPTSPLPAGGSSTFTVRFAPSATGLRTATINVPNDGINPNKNPYSFAVQGAGFVVGRESLWPDSKVGADVDNDGVYYQLGVIFQSSVAGVITDLRVFSVNGDYGDHTAYIWRTSDQAVMGGPYTWNFGRVTGWLYFDIPPVNIEPFTDYTVSVSTGTGPMRNYANIPGELADGGDNGLHLSYPPDAGVFNENSPDIMPFKSWNHSHYLRDVVFVPAGTSAAFPNVQIWGNSVLIPDGFSIPSETNHTDFGTAAMGGGFVDRTFVIANTGAAPLNLTGTPMVAVTGQQPGDFTVVTQPATPIPVGGSSELTIRFAPSAMGVRNALVVIENDDKNPFYFSIAGTGTEAQVQLRIVGFTPNLVTGDLTLEWEGGEPQFQVEKAAGVTGTFEPLGAAQAERTFTDLGALSSGEEGYYRIRQGL